MSRITKSSLLLILCLLMGLPSFAQDVDVLWGPEIKEPGKSWISAILGKHGSDYFILRESAKGLYGLKEDNPIIEKYNADMDLVFSNEIDMEMDKKNTLSLLNAVLVHGQIYLFADNYDKKADKQELYAIPVSLDGTASTPKLLYSYPVDAKKDLGYFEYDWSPDSTKLMVYYGVDVKQKESEEFEFKVFDNELEPLWERTVVLPYTEKDFISYENEVDNNGDVYVLGKVYKGKDADKDRKESDYRATIIKYSQDGEEPTEYSFDLGALAVGDVSMNLAHNDYIVTMGMYSDLEKKNNNGYNGIYYVRIDKATGEVLSSSTKEFSTELLEDFMSDKKAEKGKGVKNFDFTELVLREDGGATLVAEQYYVYTTTQKQGNVYVTIYHYNYNHMLVVDVTPEGDISWFQNIPKRQYSKNDFGEYSSYAMAVVGNSLYFVFNENEKNITNPKDDDNKTRVTKNFKKAVTVLVAIDSEGNYEKAVMFPAKEEKTIMKPKIHEQVSGNNLVVFAERGKKVRFGKIEFGE